MRLDEWQKYLDAQFVEDDSTEAPSPVAPSPLLALPPEEAPDASLVLLPIASDSVTDAIVEARGAPIPHAASPIAAETTPIPSPRSSNDTTSKWREAESLPTPIFGPPPSIEAEFPSFGEYLAARHPVADRSDPGTTTAAPAVEENTVSAVETEAAPVVEAETAPPVEAETDMPAWSDTVAGPFSVLMPTASYNVTPQRSKPPKRIPRSRAPHAHNIIPDNVPSGLSAAELWAKVPRHVQTLLALERTVDEKEVAQFSYTRPFQENRAELIERILDPILSLEDAARLLNVCPTTVRRYTNKGILTHYRKEVDRPNEETTDDKDTRHRRFRLSDILAFLETQQAAIDADRKHERRRKRLPRSSDSDGEMAFSEPGQPETDAQPETHLAP